MFDIQILHVFQTFAQDLQDAKTCRQVGSRGAVTCLCASSFRTRASSRRRSSSACRRASSACAPPAFFPSVERFLNCFLFASTPAIPSTRSLHVSFLIYPPWSWFLDPPSVAHQKLVISPIMELFNFIYQYVAPSLAKTFHPSVHRAVLYVYLY